MNKPSTIGCLLLTLVAFIPPGPASPQDALFPLNTFELGVEAEYFEYEEGALMQEDGALFGITAKYSRHNANRWMIAGEIGLLLGELDYDGQTQDGTPSQTTTEDYLFETRGLVGYDFFIDPHRAITPFTGLGYRYWNDNIEGGGGYEREIRYLYWPLGIQYHHRLNSQWRWGVTVEYDLLLQGWITTHLSDYDPGFNDPENEQDFADGYGLRASLPITYQINQTYGLGIEPFIRYWDVDDSGLSDIIYLGELIGIGLEPANDTTEIGLRIRLTF